MQRRVLLSQSSSLSMFVRKASTRQDHPEPVLYTSPAPVTGKVTWGVPQPSGETKTSHLKKSAWTIPTPTNSQQTAILSPRRLGWAAGLSFHFWSFWCGSKTVVLIIGSARHWLCIPHAVAEGLGFQHGGVDRDACPFDNFGKRFQLNPQLDFQPISFFNKLMLRSPLRK